MEADATWVREVITPHDIYLHGVSDVLVWQHTAFQQLCIAETGAFGRKLFLDGIVQSSEADEFIYHECLVQPALFAVDRPTRVLVLGGGEGACLREVLRWRSVTRALHIDLDGEVVEACRTFLPHHHRGAWDDPRAELRHEDAVAFLEETDERFDVVISDMTDPVEDGPATFCFTQEYFAKVARVLTPGGVLALQAGPQSPPEIELHARVVRTLATVFADVEAYPCPAPVYGRPLGFAIASDAPLRPRLAPQRLGPIAAELLTGESGFVDATTAGSVVYTPPYVRRAVAADTRIYTDDAPPVTHGSAS